MELPLTGCVSFFGYIAEFEKSPVKCLVTDATYVSCGADFTMWLTSVSGSSIV